MYRDDIFNCARAECCGHLCPETELKPRGGEKNRIKEKNTPFKCFTQSWSKRNKTIIIGIGRILIGFGDGNKNAISKRFGHVTVSENGGK